MTTLVARAAGGEEQAWRTLVEQYARRVYALVRSRTGRPDVAEEVTQSVFVTVAEKLTVDGYQEQGRFEAWLFRIAMNRLRDERRAAKRVAEKTESLRRHQPPDAGDHPDVPEPDELRRMHAAIESLTPADREIIDLRHAAGMEFKTIARTLNQPLGTVLARHHRALRKLRDLMTDDGDRS